MMYFIENQDPVFVKNEVILDKARLKALRCEISVRFGEYAHKVYDGKTNPYHITDISKEEMKIIQNYTEEPRGEMCHFEYDEFREPRLCKLIGRLLDGDASAIDELKKGPSFREQTSGDPDRMIELKHHMVQLLEADPEEFDLDRFSLLSEEIRGCYGQKMEQEQQEELRDYYARVLASLTFKPCMTLYKDKLVEFDRLYKDLQDFFKGTGRSPLNRF